MQTTISLAEFSNETTAEERTLIESEKKYYQLVVSLRKKREALGYTQEKLAEMSNLPRTTVTRVESGSRNATLQTLMAMAKALGKRVELRLY